jgi:hypothetical protein
MNCNFIFAALCAAAFVQPVYSQCVEPYSRSIEGFSNVLRFITLNTEFEGECMRTHLRSEEDKSPLRIVGDELIVHGKPTRVVLEYSPSCSEFNYEVKMKISFERSLSGSESPSLDFSCGDFLSFLDRRSLQK